MFEMVGVLKLLPLAAMDGRGACDGVTGPTEVVLRFLGGTELALVELLVADGGT